MKPMTLGVLAMLWGSFAGLVAERAVAGTEAGPRWNVVTAYPEDTVSGQAALDFASRLSGTAQLGAPVAPRFNDKGAVGALLSATPTVPFGLLFASDVAKDEAVLGLSVHPYEVNSIDEARELACIAAPAYRAALARHKLALLAIIAWPPTGLWSRAEIPVASEFSGMRIRTYDQTSARIMRTLGAEVVSLPIQEALALLKRGSLDAIMSSGDGAAGRSYGEVMRNFSAIRYAYPVSFLVARQEALEALTDAQRAAVFDAGVQTERQAWAQLPERTNRNYAAMANMGVQVHDPVASPVLAAIHAAARADTRARATADQQTGPLLAQFHESQAADAARCQDPPSYREASR
jgi:TRAP-type transport system periplasmic protein